MNPTKPGRFRYRLGANQPAASATARRLAEMAEAIGRESDGEFRLEVFPESRLGPDPQMFADLRQGGLQFYLSGALLGGVAPTSALPLMPFVFTDSTAVFRALDGPLGDRSAASSPGPGSTPSAAPGRTVSTTSPPASGRSRPPAISPG